MIPINRDYSAVPRRLMGGITDKTSEDGARLLWRGKEGRRRHGKAALKFFLRASPGPNVQMAEPPHPQGGVLLMLVAMTWP
jgi:hypothetical protein